MSSDNAMNDAAGAVTAFIDAHEAEARALLGEMVRIQSGSFHKEGVDAVGRLVERSFSGSRFQVETFPQTERGDHLVVRTPAAARGAGPQILLIGHMDTVFPRDTDFRDYREEGDRAYGPGVADMKGGLVVGIQALKALDAACLLEDMPVAFVFNSDEEIGSPTSRPLIRAEARKSAFALVLEAGGLDGGIVTGRKGNLSLRLDVSGRAGHAAFAGPDKASAIAELAHEILAIEALNAPAEGVTANVGLIGGGIGPNTVPDAAWARVDLRFVSPDDHDRLLEAVRAITGTPTIPDTGTRLAVVSERPSMPATARNHALYGVFSETAAALGIPVVPEFRQGVSDANLVAAEGIPVIDGLGPIGAKDHSPDEYMELASLAARTKLLALALPEAWRRHREGSLFP